MTDIIPSSSSSSSTATSMYYRVLIERSYCRIRQHSFITVPQSIPWITEPHRAGGGGGAGSKWFDKAGDACLSCIYSESPLTCQVHVKKPPSEVSLEMLHQAARETTGDGIKGDVGSCVELNVWVQSRLSRRTDVFVFCAFMPALELSSRNRAQAGKLSHAHACADTDSLSFMQ